MRLPKILSEWLRDSEMDPREMSAYSLVSEAKWCLAGIERGDESFSAEHYHPSSVAALRRFILKNS